MTFPSPNFDLVGFAGSTWAYGDR